MSGIGSVAPPDTSLPVEPHQPAERDGRHAPRRPRKQGADDDTVAAEQHKLDVEA